ncbi:14229_t:CDS:2 [Funneliformis caledonium]|uniref:14229_t:CDS:1 n=1 Tax=Funneliformis caledonium TaxID=1117310 RepID=A0A9N8W8N5_9GLOM|nr:14229_t:CDS:2 [Funneliformis caledonium]
MHGGCGIPKVTLDGTLEDWLHHQEKSRFKLTKNSIVPSSIPSGLVNVPFKLNIEKENFKLSFSAGFLGARQDKIDDEYVVSPVIGWYVADA